jgi:hypothetical protein
MRLRHKLSDATFCTFPALQSDLPYSGILQLRPCAPACRRSLYATCHPKVDEVEESARAAEVVRANMEGISPLTYTVSPPTHAIFLACLSQGGLPRILLRIYFSTHVFCIRTLRTYDLIAARGPVMPTGFLWILA